LFDRDPEPTPSAETTQELSAAANSVAVAAADSIARVESFVGADGTERVDTMEPADKLNPVEHASPADNATAADNTISADNASPAAPRSDVASASEPEATRSPSQSLVVPVSIEQACWNDAVDLPGDLAGKTVYVIDAHSLIYQVFHALPEMTSPSGLPVAAVHGFLGDVASLLEQRKPTYLFCAFDHPGDTFRHDLYSAYKEQRESMPDDLRTQIPIIEQLLDALGVPALSCPQFEADDILATVAAIVRDRGGDCVLVTGDKDCRQLLGERVRMFNIRKDEFFDARSLWESWGVKPEQVVDYQALVGDPTDNVPGVPLIGPKLARDLLQRYGTLEAVLSHAHELSGTKRRENLLNSRELVMVSRQLTRLRDDAPVSLDWPAARLGRARPALVRALCDELGFRRLAERLERLAVGGASTGPAGPAWQGDYRTIDSVEKLDAFARDLERFFEVEAPEPRWLAIDTETTSRRPRSAELVGLSFAWKEGEAYYIPVRSPEGEPRLPVERVLERLRPILESPTIGKVGQNLKYDVVVLRGYGVQVRGIAFDTLVADGLLEPGSRIHNLDELARRYLNHTTIRIEELIGTGKRQRRMDEVPLERISAYASEDADVPLRIARILERRLAAEQLESLYRDVELPLVEVLAEMEFNGIRIDVGRLESQSARCAGELESLRAEIHALAGQPFNIDSPAQLAEILFEQLKLPVVKRTKTGKSTDAEVLDELSPLHSLPRKVLEYRQLAKLKGTYLDALPAMVNPATGRIHTSLKQDVAATGRLSSSEPNLQNIPVRGEAGRAIRSAFIPGPEGWQLLAADYSQIELRVLAHFSGDAALRQAFAADQDIHAKVAGEVYGVPLEAVTTDMRRAAKAINFGIIYGQSAFGLAKSLGIVQDEAARFIDAYFARYPGVSAFLEATLDQALRQGYVATILGRRRPILGVRDAATRGTNRQRNLPERIAINSVIQGSAADLIKLAMLRIHRDLPQQPFAARLLLQIHDELLFEVAPQDRQALAAFVAERMVDVGNLTVPLKVDVKSGPNWADCEKMPSLGSIEAGSQ
jgi:DNA polymerase-1